MDISKLKTAIVVAIGILWVLCTYLGWTDHFVLGMCLGVLLMFLHLILGAAKNGVVSKKFLFYPLLCWAGLWITSFLLSKHYGDVFAGAVPDFTILGLHPSFAPTVFLYWIGGMLTLSLGLYLMQDEWLSQREWDDFVKKVSAMKEGEVK